MRGTKNSTRLSTLAEVKVLSIESLLGGSVRNVGDVIGTNLTDNVNFSLASLDAFKTVGIARTLNITEEYGTQNLYAIGEPTRPRIVPNNYQVTITAERLQLDRKNLYNYLATPEYFYSRGVQNLTGAFDVFYYSYIFVRSKEDETPTRSNTEIYAVMPRTSTKNITNSDVMIAHNVQMTGFKVNSPISFINLLAGVLQDSGISSIITTGGGGGVGGEGGNTTEIAQ